MSAAYALYAIFLILLIAAIAGTIINSSNVLAAYKDTIKEFVIEKEKLNVPHPKPYEEYGVKTIGDMIAKHKLFVDKRIDECKGCHSGERLKACKECHSYMNVGEVIK